MHVWLVAVTILLLENAPGRLSGQVLDPAGAPVVATVHSDRADGAVLATSDTRGRFSIESIPASTALIVVAPGFAPLTLSPADIEAGTARVVLQPATIAEQVTVTA